MPRCSAFVLIIFSVLCSGSSFACYTNYENYPNFPTRSRDFQIEEFLKHIKHPSVTASEAELIAAHWYITLKKTFYIDIVAHDFASKVQESNNFDTTMEQEIDIHHAKNNVAKIRELLCQEALEACDAAEKKVLDDGRKSVSFAHFEHNVTKRLGEFWIELVAELEKFYTIDREALGIVSSGNSYTTQHNELVDAMKWGTNKYPEKHYALILWNHVEPPVYEGNNGSYCK